VIAVNLVPWPLLTRSGIPQFLVARRPLLIEGREYPVGDPLPPAIIPNRVRLRQLYEQRRLEPVGAHQWSVRALNEARARTQSKEPKLRTSLGTFDQSGFESFDLPAAEVTEIDEVPAPRNKFVPRRKSRK
jgi:hypothetical protein